jgi:hypothetical protein
MPLGRPLLRGIPIEDEFTDEEVMVSLRYERLPIFCLFCGLIGHSKQNCDRPETPKTSRYNPSIGVPPTDRHDIRKWFLPEYIGQERQASSHSLPWRSSWKAEAGKTRTCETRHTAIVSHVAKRVEMLSMQDNAAANKNTKDALMINDTTTIANAMTKNSNNNSLAKIVINSGTSSDSSSTPGLEPPEILGASSTPTVVAPTTMLLPPTSPNTENANNIAKPDQDPTVKGNEQTDASAANAHTGDHATWKRRPREETKANIQEPGERTTQGVTLGATRQREEEDSTALPPVQKKKIVMQVPSMVECLGEEGLRKLMELEEAANARASFGLGDQIDMHTKTVMSESLVYNRDAPVHVASAEGTNLPTAVEIQEGERGAEGKQEQVISKKTEPKTDGKKPGTKEGAWRNK